MPTVYSSLVIDERVHTGGPGQNDSIGVSMKLSTRWREGTNWGGVGRGTHRVISWTDATALGDENGKIQLLRCVIDCICPSSRTDVRDQLPRFRENTVYNQNNVGKTFEFQCSKMKA